MFRVGIGYDVHKLVSNRKLILGGVEIPHDKGLLGHSDADVLLHAIIDALLGASGLGDIGQHFPDNNERYKNISSMLLLKHTYDILKTNGFEIINIDSTIVMQAPKIACFIPKMVTNIRECLSIDFVNVKATTEEGLGFTGSGEGVSSQAICLVLSA